MKPDTNKHRLYNALKRLVTEVELVPDERPPTYRMCIISDEALEQAYAALRSSRLNRRDPDAA